MLKPCPFCKSTDISLLADLSGAIVRCNSCECEFKFVALQRKYCKGLRQSSDEHYKEVMEAFNEYVS